MFSCLFQLPFLLRTNLTAKPTNSIAKPTNSIANGTNSIANATNSIAKATKSIANGTNSIAKSPNSIAKTCNIDNCVYCCRMGTLHRGGSRISNWGFQWYSIGLRCRLMVLIMRNNH